MEANASDIDHLDSGVLLPPRKRLLAGLKRHNSDVNSCNLSPPPFSSDFDIRLSMLSKFYSGDPNRSKEEIFEAAKLAALEAENFARSARAIAEEKAAIAVKAVAAAKVALELVDPFSNEAASKDGRSKVNMLKNHTPVTPLSNKHKGTVNNGKAVELAQTLAKATNSSPGILKNAKSDSRNHKHKKLKSSSSEKVKAQNGSAPPKENQPSTSNANGIARAKDQTRVDIVAANSDRADITTMGNEGTSQSSRTDSVNMENGKGEIISLKEKFRKAQDDTSTLSKKKAKLKQKKLPLSNFTSNDVKSKSSPSPGDNVKATANSKLVFPVERASTWKCQAFKTPASIEPNKAVQS